MSQEIVVGGASEPEPPAAPPEVRVLDDAEREAERHLKEARAAEQFPAQDVVPRPAAAPAGYARQPAPVASYQVPPSTIASRTRESVKTPIRVIEELYARYPMSEGNRVRVVRREPRKDPFGNLSTGWLGDLTAPMTMADFTSCYGGGKYGLQLIGPTDAARNDFSERVIVEMTLEIPGVPRMIIPAQLADSEDPMTQQRVGMFPAMEPERVAVKRLEVEAQQRERLDDREREQKREERESTRTLFEMSRPSDTSIEAIRDTARQTVEESRRQNEVTLDIMRNTVLEQQKQLLDKENELKELRREVVTARQEAVTAINNAETRMVADLREQKRVELDNLRDTNRKEVEVLRQRYDEDSRKYQADYAARLETDSRKYQADLQEQTRKNEADRREAEQRAERERAAAREDARAKEETMRAAYEDRIRQMQDNFNSRIQDLERSTARELTANKEQRDLALTTIRETHESRAKVEGKTSEIQITALQHDLQTARTRVDTLERENEKMRAEIHKPPLKAIEEAEKLSRAVGMVRPDEVEHPEVTPAGDGKMDWGQMAMSVVKGLAEKSPELLQKLSEMRSTNAAAAAAPVPGVVTRQLGAAPGAVPPMAPAAVRQRRRGPPPTPGTMYGAPPPLSGPPPIVAAPRYVQPPVVSATQQTYGAAEPPSVGSPGPAPVPQVPFGAPGYDAGSMQAQWDASAAAVAPPAQAPQAPQAAPTSIAPPPAQPAAAPQPQVSDMQVQLFVQQLENAITTNVDPAQFASVLIQQIGPQMAVQTIGQVTPEAIVEMVSGTPAGASSPIVTRSGEKYLQAVWEAARVQLRAAGAQI